MKTMTKLWIGLGILIVLSPLGLLLPQCFKAGSAWGEWGPEEIQKLIGYIPEGLGKLLSFWKAPLPDYAFKGWEEKGALPLSIAYIVSAVVGIAATVAVIFLTGKILTRKK